MFNATPYNIPQEVKDKFQQELDKRQGHFVVLKSSLSVHYTETIRKQFPTLCDSFWSENEIAFLQAGTSRQDADLFVKEFLKELFKDFLTNVIASIDEDIKE